MTQNIKIPSPFTPLEVTEKDGRFTVSFLSGSVTFSENLLPVSFKSGDVELLSRPVEIRTVEDGEDGCFEPDESYIGESEAFIQSRSPEKVVLCGALQSRRFIIDLAATVSYDGNIAYSMKVVPRGLTVAQCFRLDDFKPPKFALDSLHLEVPLKREESTLYQIYPESEISLEGGGKIPYSNTTSAGELPRVNAAMPFKANVWLGSDDRGLGYFSDSDRFWQPADMNRVIEWLPGADETVMRVHILDSYPKSWLPERKQNNFAIPFSFGFQVTPVKPLPKSQLIKGLHIDCFKKTTGNYIDYLLDSHTPGIDENGFDRMKRLGVDTLILHEKWNKSQNFVELSEYTENQIKRITSECHKRGIKVLTYFGYEYSTMAYDFDEFGEKYSVHTADKIKRGGWYRVPYQRDYVVCYNSDYADRWVEGIARIMDTCHTDGIYLDGTSRPQACANTAHGCGYYDDEGKLHQTFTNMALRRMFEKLYIEVHSRGGLINVHTSGSVNFTALPFIDLLWCGEDLQVDYTHGNFSDVPLGYFRAMYTGFNLGVPVELIAYENRPTWNFENALATSIIHGVLPRPNDIGFPLEYMSDVWKIYDSFPIAQSEWLPYYKNGGELSTSDERVKASMYRHTSPDGETMCLIFASNVSMTAVEDVNVSLTSDIRSVVELPAKSKCDFGGTSFATSLEPYTCRIFIVR